MSTPAQPNPETSPEAGDSSASNPAFLVLGRIVRPHGIQGELRVQIATAYPERIAHMDEVYVGHSPHDPNAARAFAVEGARRHRDYLLVRLKGINDRTEAENYRGLLLMVSLTNAVPLEDDEYYLFQVIGARVVTTEGETLGKVSEVLETGANDVFVVQGGPRGEVLIPDIKPVIVSIDIEAGVITVDPPEGLLPD
jgi:16S rRNA processing protein RimM